MGQVPRVSRYGPAQDPVMHFLSSTLMKMLKTVRTIHYISIKVV